MAEDKGRAEVGVGSEEINERRGPYRGAVIKPDGPDGLDFSGEIC
jgi:hypothetical protein